MSAVRTRTRAKTAGAEFVTNNQLRAELQGMRWEIRFLVVAGLVLGQIGMRIDVGGPVKTAALALVQLIT